MTLRPATAADFPFLHALAQRSDYAPFITDEDDSRLAGYLADPDAALVIWQAGAVRGFGLYCGLAAPGANVELRRLALDQAGGGNGAAFLKALVDHAFEGLGARRLWLDASSENLRAQRAYQRAGFTLEGRLRAHWWRPALGRPVDLMLYGMFADERPA